jgi:hypothetical protein
LKMGIGVGWGSWIMEDFIAQGPLQQQRGGLGRQL